MQERLIQHLNVSTFAITGVTWHVTKYKNFPATLVVFFYILKEVKVENFLTFAIVKIRFSDTIEIVCLFLPSQKFASVLCWNILKE